MGPTYRAGTTSLCVQLTDVYILDGIQFNLSPLHQVQREQGITFTKAGVHLMQEKLPFDRNSRSS